MGLDFMALAARNCTNCDKKSWDAYTSNWVIRGDPTIT